MGPSILNNSFGIKAIMKRLYYRLSDDTLSSFYRLYYKLFIRRNRKIGTLIFQCNICGHICNYNMSMLKRDSKTCNRCGSSVRMRSIISTLSLELFGKNIPLYNFPCRPEIIGIGLSDNEGMAFQLRRKFTYKNTFYHKEPKLDIASIDPMLKGTMDFIISSDVFEHVNPPIANAFKSLRKLIKPTGVIIFSVPYNKNGEETIEHFPNLHEYNIVRSANSYILQNKTRDGEMQIYDNLCFHGGEGRTLELRVFTEKSLINEFENAGFHNIKIYNQPLFESGIYWGNDDSFPMAVRVNGVAK